MKKPDGSVAQQLAAYSMVFGSLIGSIGAGLAIGWALWKKLGFPGWTLGITVGLGLSAACYQIIRYQRRVDQIAEEKENRP